MTARPRDLTAAEIMERHQIARSTAYEHIGRAWAALSSGAPGDASRGSLDDAP